MTLPLFCFGSLMDRDVLAMVIGGGADKVTMRPARISGFFRARLPHESYPMLVPDAEQEALGQLLYGLDKTDLDRIVFFEGEEYELSPCRVRLLEVSEKDEGESVEALFFDEGIMPPPQTEAWDFEHWQQHNKPYMLRQSRVYMSLFGKMSAAEADVYWQNYKE